MPASPPARQTSPPRSVRRYTWHPLRTLIQEPRSEVVDLTEKEEKIAGSCKGEKNEKKGRKRRNEEFGEDQENEERGEDKSEILGWCGSFSWFCG